MHLLKKIYHIAIFFIFFSVMPNLSFAEVSLKKRFSIDISQTGTASAAPLTNGGLLTIGGKDSTSTNTSARLYTLYDKKGREYDNGTLLDKDLSGTSNCVTPSGGKQTCAYYTQKFDIIGPDIIAVTVAENIPQLSSDGSSVKNNQTINHFLVDTKIGSKGNRITVIGNGSFPLLTPLPSTVKTTYIVIDKTAQTVELDDIISK